MIKIIDLEAYRAVMSTGSTQGAAELLGISQSAVSRRISQLEEELGIQLFIREGARIVPSRLNELLETHVADVLERVHILDDAANKIRSGRYENALLRIAVPPGICRKIMPKIIAGFLDKYPQTRFEILHGTYDVISRMLDEKQAEIGFLRLPFRDSNFMYSDVIIARSVCVMAKNHPLTKHKIIRPENLRDEPLVLLGRRRSPRHDLDLVFSSHGVRPKIRLEAHSVSSACGFSAEGIGVSIVNSLLVQDCMDLDTEVRLFLPDVPHHFAFVYPDKPRLPELGAEFITYATGYLQALEPFPA
ncbi:LysR family transcriptional regulator [Hyphomicrobiales bacterium]|uniref:LysR family transcriptional regulator n=1 Tax=Pseudochrobactrum asaccharolyticum TaxID=354351 RepID=UPI000EFDA88E